MLRLSLLFVAVTLAGCIGTNDDDFGDHMGDDDHMGGNHHHGSSDGNIAYTGQEDILVTIVAGDPEEFRFIPTNVTVQEGQSVGITFRNDGDVAHEFSINDYDFHLHLEPGQEAQAAFVADDEGTFTFGCYIPGHFETGMKGTLTVEPAEA